MAAEGAEVVIVPKGEHEPPLSGVIQQKSPMLVFEEGISEPDDPQEVACSSDGDVHSTVIGQETHALVAGSNARDDDDVFFSALIRVDRVHLHDLS